MLIFNLVAIVTGFGLHVQKRVAAELLKRIEEEENVERGKSISLSTGKIIPLFAATTTTTKTDNNNDDDKDDEVHNEGVAEISLNDNVSAGVDRPVGGRPLQVTIGTSATKSERGNSSSQMSAEDINELQMNLDASNRDMRKIRKVRHQISWSVGRSIEFNRTRCNFYYPA